MNRTDDINNVKHFEVFTLYANTNMADARIVCPICTVILSRARLDSMAKWLACQTLKPEDQVEYRMGTNYICLFFAFSPCNAKLLHTSNKEFYKYP